MAYNTATPVQKDPPDVNGRVRLVVEFTGNASEPPMRRERYVDNETIAELQAWARAEVASLSGRRAGAATIVEGTPISLVPPAAPPAPTAAQIAETAWLENVRRLERVQALGAIAAGTFATEIAALRALVASSYVAGYLGRF